MWRPFVTIWCKALVGTKIEAGTLYMWNACLIRKFTYSRINYTTCFWYVNPVKLPLIKLPEECLLR